MLAGFLRRRRIVDLFSDIGLRDPNRAVRAPAGPAKHLQGFRAGIVFPHPLTSPTSRLSTEPREIGLVFHHSSPPPCSSWSFSSAAHDSTKTSSTRSPANSTLEISNLSCPGSGQKTP